jgi:ferredoxin
MYVPLRRIPRYDDPGESTWGLVQVDDGRCNGCGLCGRACPSRVLVLDGDKARMRGEGVVQCMACGDCTAICPAGAIALLRSYRFTGAYATRDRGPLRPPRL